MHVPGSSLAAGNYPQHDALLRVLLGKASRKAWLQQAACTGKPSSWGVRACMQQAWHAGATAAAPGAGKLESPPVQGRPSKATHLTIFHQHPEQSTVTPGTPLHGACHARTLGHNPPTLTTQVFCAGRQAEHRPQAPYDAPAAHSHAAGGVLRWCAQKGHTHLASWMRGPGHMPAWRWF